VRCRWRAEHRDARRHAGPTYLSVPACYFTRDVQCQTNSSGMQNSPSSSSSRCCELARPKFIAGGQLFLEPRAAAC
jgi:hypothetical protein